MVLIVEPWGRPTEPDGQAYPLTRGQLDTWLAQESGRSDKQWQLGQFVKIEGTVDRDVPEWAIHRAVREAERGRAAIFEADGQVFHRAMWTRLTSH